MPYLRHFELRETPFGLTPDTSFLFPARSVQQTLEALRAAVSSDEAFIEVTGAAGMGKTLLCRTFIALLDRARWVALHIPNPGFDPRSLSIALAEALSVPLSAATGAELDQHSLRKGIGRALLAHARAGRRVVLCLDESQAMPLETLEALRLLTNLETGKRKLLQVVLFGQPELDRKLDSETAGQLRQRISVQREHAGLADDEVGAYISHRLKVAGYAGPPLFSGAAV
ncbi:MAG TPA: AAA family ATPase, partial [Burkholderiales bacterium]|nr:AAA family ATPase [Burkholderiales bacterium]